MYVKNDTHYIRYLYRDHANYLPEFLVFGRIATSDTEINGIGVKRNI